jgi:hypothetical protein
MRPPSSASSTTKHSCRAGRRWPRWQDERRIKRRKALATRLVEKLRNLPPCSRLAIIDAVEQLRLRGLPHPFRTEKAGAGIDPAPALLKRAALTRIRIISQQQMEKRRKGTFGQQKGRRNVGGAKFSRPRRPCADRKSHLYDQGGMVWYCNARRLSS